MMKVIVAGSRTITLQSIVDQAIIRAFNYWMKNDQDNWQYYTQPEIVSGGAQGVDFLGEKYALKHKLKCTVFPANWELHGRKAGILRNREMAFYADRLIAIWDGKSRGTLNMIQEMNLLNKLVYVQCP